MDRGYWQTLTQKRTSRRVVVVGGVNLAGAAALLAACGGSSSNAGSSSTPTLASKPVDTTQQAKAGGVMKDYTTGDPTNFDPLISNSTGTLSYTNFAYPRLLKYTLAQYPKTSDGSIEGDVASTYEYSGDKLQLTFKIRPNMKWDNRAPTNGRLVDAQDVVFSWNKYVKLNPSAQDLTASIDSVSAPDSSTVVVKLKQLDSTIVPLFAEGSHFRVMPRESDTGFDPKKDVRGAGPWMLDSYNPSVSVNWKRNPDYYIKDRPFPDQWVQPIIPELTTRLAQFRTGSIYTSVVSTGDVLQTKQDLPKTVLQQARSFAAGGNYLSFGYEGDSPFKDARVRQAFSMLVDPDEFAILDENKQQFEAAGLPIPIARNTVLYAGWGPMWLDPTDDKAFGDTNKYLKFDPASAKQLLTAAGFANGFEFTFTYDGDGRYASPYPENVQLFAAQLTRAGMKIKQNSLPYNDYYNNYFLAYVTNGPGFNGMIMRVGRSFPTAIAQYQGQVHKDGSVYHGTTADGKNAQQGDPKVNSAIDQMKAEFDTQKQQLLSHDLIKYYTGQAYTIARPTISPVLTVTWPIIANIGLDDPWVGEPIWNARIDWWLDPTKAPAGNS